MRELRHVPPLKRPRFAIVGRMQVKRHGKLIFREKRFSNADNSLDAASKIIGLHHTPQYKRWSFIATPIVEKR
jgi:hypothetical protein